ARRVDPAVHGRAHARVDPAHLGVGGDGGAEVVGGRAGERTGAERGRRPHAEGADGAGDDEDVAHGAHGFFSWFVLWSELLSKLRFVLMSSASRPSMRPPGREDERSL